MAHHMRASETDPLRHLLRRVAEATGPPPPPPPPPIILIEDWDGKPTRLVTKYVNGKNEINFLPLFKKIKNLKGHAGRGRQHTGMEDGQPRLRVKECSKKFLDAFWDCVAKIMDYLADFFEKDSGKMQSLWFHLIDQLQEAAKLPHDFWVFSIPHCSHAQQFSRFYAQSLEIFSFLATNQYAHYHGTVVYPDKEASTGNTAQVGSFKSGLKPWQQFLNRGSPGFNVPHNQHNYEPFVDLPEKTESEKFVPLGALAIIHTHYERFRSYAEACSRETDMETDYTQDFVPTGSSLHTAMENQGQIIAPFAPNTSARNAPVKKDGVEDLSILGRKPNLNSLDETVGNYRGSTKAADTVGGGAFKMWRVVSDNRTDTQACDPQPDMFDEWQK